MKNKIALYLVIGVFLLSACSPAVAGPTTTSFITPVPATNTVEASPTSSPTETPAPSHLVIYDFQELHCQATWTNNGQNLPCTANIYDENLGGSVSIANESDMESITLVGDSALMTYPAHDGSFRGIFGAYPPISIVQGDEFRATIGCMGVTTEFDECDVEYSLEYYDANENYFDSQITGWFWNETNDGEIHEIVVDLSALAGQTVRLVLVVRDNGDPTDDTALWLHPQLWRSQFNP